MNRRTKGALRAPVVIILGLLAALAFGVGSAAASTYSCTNSSADQAALQALINAGGTVTISGTCRGHWTDSAANVTIQAGAPGATLNGNSGGSVLSVSNGKTATLEGLTVTNGAASSGGGINAFGGLTTVNVNNSTLTRNTATAGGAIIADFGAVVNVTGSTLTGNTALVGGGIYVVFATVNLTATTLHANSASFAGGGIYADFATTSIASSRLTTNTSFEGGAIANFDGSMTLTGSSVDHNALTGTTGGGGGILNGAFNANATLTLTNTSVSFNTTSTNGRGGGIFQTGNNHYTASILATGSTFAGNTAKGGPGSIPGEGGAIYTEGNGGTTVIALANTAVGQTLNPNRAQYGGGIYNNGFNGGFAGLSLEAGADIVANQASITGGGIDNTGGTVNVNPGARVLFNKPNNCTGC